MPHIGDYQPVVVTQPFIFPAAFLNGWAPFGGIYNTPGYWKDALGVVHLRGLMAGGVVGSPAFVLPAGYRPTATELIGVASNGAFGVLGIDNAGNVTPSIGSNIWFGLDSVTFKAV